MAIRLDKRIHWFVGTNKRGQQMRMCNGYVSGRFVAINDEQPQAAVTCSAGNKTLENPEKLAKKVFEYNQYRDLWG